MANTFHTINGETFNEHELQKIIHHSETVDQMNYWILFKVIIYHIA